MNWDLMPSANIKECTGGKCCGSCDTPDRRFYVSVAYHGRFTMLSGPYLTHQEALNMVAPVRLVSESIDARSVWYAFGTCSVQDATGDFPPLNGDVANMIRRRLAQRVA